MRLEFSKVCHAPAVALALPRAGPKPQRMRVSRTLRPHCVDELVMHVLLRIVDDALNVGCGIIDEPTKSHVVQGHAVVISSDRCVQITNK